MPRPESMLDKLMGEAELLERHIRMLEAVAETQPVGIIRLSEILGMPKHKVRYSLRMLEQEGLIEPSSEGARVTGRYGAYMAEASESLDRLIGMLERLRDGLPPGTV